MSGFFHDARYLSALVLGLAGSLHCISMCGPLAAIIPMGKSPRTSLTHFYYHTGRVSTYALLGLFSGSLGFAFNQSGLQQFISIFFGVVLIAAYLARKKLVVLPPVLSTFKFLQKTTAIFLRQPNAESMFVAGMLNGLLPCGLVYTSMAAASLLASPGASAVYMLIFGLGTIPALFLVSTASHKLKTPTQRLNWAKITPLFTLVAGGFLIIRGMALGIPYVSPSIPEEFGAAPICCPHTTSPEAD